MTTGGPPWSRTAILLGAGIVRTADGLEPDQRRDAFPVVIAVVNAEADFRPHATADRTAEQEDNIPEPARLVPASDAGRHADAALPGDPRQGRGPADARLPGRRAHVDSRLSRLCLRPLAAATGRF